MSITIQILITMVVVIVLLLLIALWVKYKSTSNNSRSQNRQLNAILKPYSLGELNHVIFPDGIGGLVDVEKLILLEQGLLIIETYPISGKLFGANTVDQWTQMIDGKSYKFINPIDRIEALRQAIQSMATGTPIFCRIVFTGSESSFPKGKPEEVSLLSTLNDDLSAIKNSAVLSQKHLGNWDKIVRIAEAKSGANHV